MDKEAKSFLVNIVMEIAVMNFVCDSGFEWQIESALKYQ